MTTSKDQVSVKIHAKAQEVSQDESVKARKPRETIDSPLMSPVALMALGLAGAATAAISKEFLSDVPAAAPDATLVGAATSPDALAATELVVDSASPIATQMNALIQELLAEKATSVPHQGRVVAAGDAAPEADVAVAKEAAGTAPASVAVEELPMLLAQASTATPTGVVSESAAAGATGAGAASGGAAAAVATSTAASTALLIGVGLLGVAALGSSSSSGGVATPTPPPSDTTPPVIQSLTIGGDKILTLTYDSALDSSNLPPLTAFKVTTNGVDNPVTVVAVNGSALTLTLTNSVAAGTLHLTYTDPTAGNDALAVQDIAGNDAVSVIQGIVADGYVRDAQIYIDVNKNGVADSAEIVAGVVTDANGNFFLPSTAPAGTIIAKGGVNIDTGVVNTLALKAPAGSTTVNPLTTLVQAVMDAAPTGTSITAEEAAATVADALGLTLPAGTYLTTYDPLSATDVNALATQQAAAQVATLLTLAGSAPATGTTTTQAVDTVIGNLVDQINAASSTSPIDLSNSTTVADLFKDAGGVSVATEAALSDAQTAVTAISAATTLADVTLAQSAALDNTAPAAPGIDLVDASDTGASATDNATSDTTPTLRVSLEVTKTDGTAVVAGDTVVINDGANQIGTATVTVADVAQGFIDVTLSEQADASYSLTSAVIDKGTNASASSANLTVTIDTTVAVPATTLTTNSGLSTDSITNVGTVNVTGLETGASWQYSLNAGTNWTAGTGTSVTLTGDGAKSVTVRQTDVAGNVSVASTELAFTLDGTASAPTLALAINSGVSTDNISNVGTVNVTGLEAGASWEYNLNAGTSWTAGTGTSVILTGDGAKSVTVRQTDVAGNTSAASSALAFTLDSTAAAPTASLATNSGVSTDSITNVGTVNVAGLESGATWEYNVNGGAFTAGTGTSVTLTGDGAKSVTVRQTDVAGNTSEASGALEFMLDASAPTVSPSSPAVGGLTLGLAANLVLAANETLVKGSGTVSIFKADNSLVETINITDARVSLTGTGANTQVSINPVADLTKDTQYYVKVSSGALTDVAGNAWAGIADATSWDFTGAGATVVVDTVAGDDVVNLAESGQTITITGTLGAEASVLADYTFADMTAVLNPVSGKGVTLENFSYTYLSGTTGTWSADVPALALSGTGDYTLTVTFTGSADAAAGIVGVGTKTVHVDTVVVTPTALLVADTGASNSDLITSNGAVTASGTEEGAVLQYSVDGGSTWTGSFSAVTGSNSVQVRQTDMAGNVSAASGALVFTLDATAAAAPALVLTTDTGASGTDKITSDGAVTVSGTEDGAVTQYSIDGGSTWTSDFTAVQGANTVQVRQTDVAGNTSAASSALAFTFDITAAAPVVALTTDTGSSASDKITNNGTVTVTGAEQGAMVQYSTDGGSNWTSSFTAVAGANSVQVRQTDVAGNTSAASGALAFTLDTAAAAPVVALTTDTGSSTSDKITNNGAVTVTGVEQGATVQYSTDGGSSWTSSFTGVAGVNSVQVRQTDVAGNVSGASSAYTFTLDTAAPTVVISEPNTVPNSTTGALTFDFTFSEAVTGFDANDISVGNGTKGSLVTTDASHYSLVVTPTSSGTPLELSVAVPAAGAVDTAGNTSAVANQFLASILYGTAGNDSLTVGPSLDHIFLGAGADVIRVTNAAHSTLDLPDSVMDFASGDKIDLATLLGTGGSGYSGSAMGDTGAGFVELKNVTLTQDSTNNWTVARFDISFDTATINSSLISAASIDLEYQYGLAVDGLAISPMFGSRAVWQLIQPNLSPMDGGTGSQINGQIALVANPISTNPIITTANVATGTVLTVELTLQGLLSQFDIGIKAAADGGNTTITTADNVTHNVDVGVTKTAGLTVGADGILEIITGTLGTVGDNQLHMVATYVAEHNTTHLQVQYDTNSAFGTSVVSSVIAFDFDGDVTANLTPASLTFI